MKNIMKNSTELAEFKPTAGMKVWLASASQLMSDDISEIAKACGLDRSNWYKWQEDERFIPWFKEEWDRRLAGHAWKLDAIGLRQSKKDHKYWESMQKRVGNLTDQPTVAVQVNNNFDAKRYMR